MSFWFGKSRRPPGRRPLGVESLESRYAMAALGLGVTVLNDNAGTPGAARTAPLTVGDTFWVQVRAQDIRTAPNTPAGVIGLALNLSWDSDNLQLLNPPTAFAPNTISPSNLITNSFPLIRTVDAYTPAAGHTGFVEPPVGAVPTPAVPSLDNLQAGALPNAGQGMAIGATDPSDPNFGYFSLLRFRAVAVGDDT